MKIKKLSRRNFIVSTFSYSLALTLLGCERHKYVRPAQTIDLGPVKDLLYDKVHVRERGMLCFRDERGWSALSVRCTYDGCDMTLQEPVLLCPCCKSRFNLGGIPVEGSKASDKLPWCEVSYRDGHLYANPGIVKPPDYRFTTPDIEKAIVELRKRVKDGFRIDEVQIPDVLKGKVDDEEGVMFLENDPVLLDEIDMIK